jgi:hypothetical protein
MEEMNVTAVWMGGVVAMMLVMAGIAMVGLYLQRKRGDDE